jgi:lysophospholipase L1-like esterase
MSFFKSQRGQSLALLSSLLFTVPITLHAQTIRLDFGPDDGTNGSQTTNPDTNGNSWNNAIGIGEITPGLTINDLVTTDNKSTSLGVTLSAGWRGNGILNGGLLDPSPALLGELAIGEATQDYFFLEGEAAKALVTISGLDSAKLYTFRFFGTRATDDVRETTYRLTAGNGMAATSLQTSGAGIGEDGSYNGNDNSVAEIADVQSDTTGRVELEVSVTAGNFGYLGAMEIVTGEAAEPIDPPVTTSKAVLIDFGRTNGLDGNLTVSPDTNGNTWNNFFDFFNVRNDNTLSNLRTTDKAPTSLTLTTFAGWSANGIRNGGLLNPSANLLGDFAVGTATEDYLFVNGDGANAELEISGLNPQRVYEFSFFGTRATPDTRETEYEITAGSGTSAINLVTSGSGISADGTSNGNDSSLAVLENIQSDTSGKVRLKVTAVNGGFGYLGAMKIVETGSAPPILPEPPANIARWVEQDQLAPPQPGSVLFVGSSSIRRWEALTRDFADYRITQRGFGGSQLPELNGLVDFIVHPYEASGIVLWEGTNDVKVAGRTGAQVSADFDTFVDLVRSKPATTDTPIFFLGIAPTPGYGADPDADSRRRDANTLIAATCAEDETLNYIDLPTFFESIQDNSPGTFQSYYSDNTHFSKKGYDEWTNIIRPSITSVIAPNKTYVPNPDTLTAGESFLFDFGPSDETNGDPSTGTDARGNFWNNWHDTNGGGTVNSGEHLANLVKASGEDSGIRITITGGFLVNGKLNGGLFAPQEFLLGDLAVETATEDYFFSTGDDLYNAGSDDVPGGLMIEGLDPELTYNVSLFGSRENTQTRTTEFKLFGSDNETQNLTTSGAGIANDGAGNGNDDDILLFTGVRPDAFGQLFLDATLISGDFAYLNAMKVEAVTEATSAIENWRSENFTPAELAEPSFEESLWGNDADPDNDGRSNLMEYATGTDARANDLSPITTTLRKEAVEQLFTFTYQKKVSANDITFQVEESTDLITFTPVPDSLVSTVNDLEIRESMIVVGEDAPRFLRLKVTLMP